MRHDQLGCAVGRQAGRPGVPGLGVLRILGQYEAPGQRGAVPQFPAGAPAAGARRRVRVHGLGARRVGSLRVNPREPARTQSRPREASRFCEPAVAAGYPAGLPAFRPSGLPAFRSSSLAAFQSSGLPAFRPAAPWDRDGTGTGTGPRIAATPRSARVQPCQIYAARCGGSAPEGCTAPRLRCAPLALRSALHCAFILNR